MDGGEGCVTHGARAYVARLRATFVYDYLVLVLDAGDAVSN